MAREFNTILDELQQLFAQQGHSVQTGSFQNDQVKFMGRGLQQPLVKPYGNTNTGKKQLDITVLDALPNPERERATAAVTRDTIEVSTGLAVINRKQRGRYNPQEDIINAPVGLNSSPAQLMAANQTTVAGQTINKPDKDKSEMQIEMKPSSTIQSVAYWPTKLYLLVSFKSGHTYSYEQVPEPLIDQWQSAPSAGSFFYYNIRMSYRYQKVS